MAKAPAVRWTREHFLIALNLYCKLPFGKLDKGNPFPQPALEQNFVSFAGQAIRLPEKLAEPNPEFLAHHRDSIFSG